MNKTIFESRTVAQREACTRSRMNVNECERSIRCIFIYLKTIRNILLFILEIPRVGFEKILFLEFLALSELLYRSTKSRIRTDDVLTQNGFEPFPFDHSGILVVPDVGLCPSI